MAAFLDAVWDVLLVLAPWLLLGAALAGVLHVLLPTDFVRRHLRGRGAVARAVGLGVPLPLCSCGVIPAGLGLKKDGASDGAAVGFLISTPQTGVDSVLVSASFLGWPFAVFKVMSAAVTGIVGGLLADRVAREAPVAEASAPPSARRRDVRAGVAHALEILRTIWRWIVVGVLASAAITVFVPPSAFQSVSAAGEVTALLVALAISLPLYVCATASVPIAAALVAGGFPPGAALVFLMAGPATNLATIGAVHKAFGRRTTLVYLGTIVIGSLVLGMAFDFVLAHEVLASAHVHEGSQGLAGIAAGALVLLLLWFGLDDLRGLLQRLRAGAPTSPTERTLRVAVEGMTCNGCVRHLEKTLDAEPGITSRRVDLQGKSAEVTGKISEERLRELVRAAGYTPR